MRRKKSLLLVFTVLALLLESLSGCGKEAIAKEVISNGKTKKLQQVLIGFPAGGSDFAGGVLGEADVKGYLKQYLEPLGYEAVLEPFPGAAPAIHEALISKEIDYVVYAGMAGILGKSNGIDTKLLAINGYNCSWHLVVRNDSNIRLLQDLEGKKIAYTRGASPHLYLISVLKQGELNFDRVEAYNMTLSDGLSALAAGSVDAAVVMAGQEEQLVKEGIVTVLHSGHEQEGEEFYEPTVFIGRSEVIEQKEEVTIGILKALLRAKDEIAKDEDAFNHLAAEKSGNPLEVIRATAPNNVETGYPVNLEENYLSSLEKIQETLRKEKLIFHEIVWKDWVEPSFFIQARKEYQNEEKH